MKKSLLIIILCLLLCSCNTNEEISVTSSKVVYENMDAVSSGNLCFGDKHILNLRIITYEPITDYNVCANEIIQHCIDNDFHTILFSYDINGYPAEVNATVYESESSFEDGISIFTMQYSQDNNTFDYNIKDGGEHFTMEITPTI